MLINSYTTNINGQSPDHHVVKLSPQPHVPFAKGLVNVNSDLQQRHCAHTIRRFHVQHARCAF